MDRIGPATAVWTGDGYRPGRGAALTLVDPSTGEILGVLDSASADDVDDVVEISRLAGRGSWSTWSPPDRGRLCQRIGAAIEADEETLVDLVEHDSGLPTWMARADVRAAVRYFEYYSGLADKLGGETIPLGSQAVDFTVREPWGVCAVVVPFNVPVQMAARSIAPALIGGNTVVLKPADQAPLAQLRLVELIATAGTPAGVVTAVVGDGATVGAPLVSHPAVDHVTFTGSLEAGRRVLAGTAHSMTPSLIELGGKSPHLVLAGADLELAVPAIVGSALRTAGQVCSAGSLVLVDRSLHGQTLEMLGAAADGLQVGRADADPDVGPVVSAVQRDLIVDAVATSVAAGGEITTTRPSDAASGSAFFVNPTVIAAPSASNPAAREEIFGPVLTVVEVDSPEHALAVCDASPFGLVAGVWTSDIGLAHRAARDIRAGQVFINSYGVGGGVELPFGGYRRSGFGRLKGVAGAVAYTQLKNVCVAL